MKSIIYLCSYDIFITQYYIIFRYFCTWHMKVRTWQSLLKRIFNLTTVRYFFLKICRVLIIAHIDWLSGLQTALESVLNKIKSNKKNLLDRRIENDASAMPPNITWASRDLIPRPGRKIWSFHDISSSSRGPTCNKVGSFVYVLKLSCSRD